MSISELVPLDQVPVLDPKQLDAAAERAAAEFIADGTPTNSARSYGSAMRYCAAWFGLRYGECFAGPLPVPVVIQFVLDHLERSTATGLEFELPPAVDARLIELGAKRSLGPLTIATVRHRLAVLAKWHRLNRWDCPTDDYRVKTLLCKAGRAHSKRVSVRKKTAATLEPLLAMLATCTDGVRGIRDRALLLLAWSGGGRRRSEVVSLEVTDLRAITASTWVYALGNTKTNRSGAKRMKPLRDEAVEALKEWLEVLDRTAGPLFPRLFRGEVIGERAMTADHVARMIKRRAKLAQLSGDWAAHSLRSGFVTEAGRQGVPLGEVMAMTEHRGSATVMGYFQAGELMESRVSSLLRVKPKF